MAVPASAIVHTIQPNGSQRQAPPDWGAFEKKNGWRGGFLRGICARRDSVAAAVKIGALQHFSLFNHDNGIFSLTSVKV
jgi:hypothetical protein